jgi:hypothetical protein
MNEAQLSQFNIPTESKSAATAFLRQNTNVAHEFAKFFGFDDADDRIALRAAQMVAVAIFEEVDDVAAVIGPKVEQYRTYIQNTTAPAPVTVTTVEVAAEPASVEPVIEATANDEPVVVETASEPEVAAEPEVTVEPEAEPVVVAPKASSGRRGRQAYAATGKLTAYEKCVNWFNTNNITGTNDRSALAIQMYQALDIPVPSCLVYISKAFKAGILTK